jgi:hypothetical protein
MKRILSALLLCVISGTALAQMGMGPGPGIGAFSAGGGGPTLVFNYSSGFTTGGQSSFVGTTDACSPLFSGTQMRVNNGLVGQHQACGAWYTTKVSDTSFTSDFTIQLGAESISGEQAYTGDGTTKTFSSYSLQQGIRPGTLTVTAGSVTGTDNGVGTTGTISGTGISGTIDYRSLELDLTFTTAPANGTAITVAYQAPNYGMGFVVQNDPLGTGASADANGIGISSYTFNNPDPSIHDSVALMFNATPNSVSGAYVVGRTPSMIGLYVNGGPYVNGGINPVQDMLPQGINLYSGDPIAVHVVYDGTTLTADLNDTTSGARATFAWPINIPAITGGSTAYFGFGAGSIPAGVAAVNGWELWTGYNSRLSQVSFSPAPGHYTTSQSVTLSGPAGSTIYYSTNGNPPTTSSSVYSSAISVTANEAIQAMAVKSGSTNSLTSIGNYQIQASATPVINFASGFSGAASLLQTAGIANISGSTLILTDGGDYAEIGSAYYVTPVTVSTFSTTFVINYNGGSTGAQEGADFVIMNPGASQNFNTRDFQLIAGLSPGALSSSTCQNNCPSPDNWGGASGTYGLMFDDSEVRNNVTFTNGSPTASWTPGLTGSVGVPLALGRPLASAIVSNAYTLGQGGYRVFGYGGIGSSIAVEIDDWDDSICLGLNGKYSNDCVQASFNFGSNPLQVTITYDGTTLTAQIEDTVTLDTYSRSWAENIPSIVGASTAYVGLTGSTYGGLAPQKITSWTF